MTSGYLEAGEAAKAVPRHDHISALWDFRLFSGRRVKKQVRMEYI
jgi:hypothetical protein